MKGCDSQMVYGGRHYSIDDYLEAQYATDEEIEQMEEEEEEKEGEKS